jgi:hypothetical protein
MEQDNKLISGQKMSLSDIFDMMKQVDDGIMQLTELQMQELGNRLLEKADGYSSFIDKIEDEEKRVTEKAKQLSAYKKTLKNILYRTEQIAIYNLEQNGLDKLLGENNQAKLVVVKNNKLKWKVDVEPTQDLYMKFRSKGFIKQSFEWVDSELKKALETPEAQDIADFVELVDSKYLKWSIRKNI